MTAPAGGTLEMPAGPRPGGRSYSANRPVRLADVHPSGSARLDAVARYLHDIAADDVADAGVGDTYRWVVRRTSLAIHQRPRYEDHLEVVTWCSGLGAAWAERRTTLRVGGRVLVEAGALWVALDPVELRPCQAGGTFAEIYRPGTEGRVVASRFLHGPAVPAGIGWRRRWALRDSDVDMFGHVNNAVAWAAVEEGLRRRLPGTVIVSGEVEYRAPIRGLEALEVLVGVEGSSGTAWLVDEAGEVLVSARVSLAPSGEVSV